MRVPLDLKEGDIIVSDDDRRCRFLRYSREEFGEGRTWAQTDWLSFEVESGYGIPTRTFVVSIERQRNLKYPSNYKKASSH